MPVNLDGAVVLRLLNDTRLSAESRAVVMYVYARGDGAHEIGFPELRRLLNQAGTVKVRTAVSDAEETGWLTVVRGGNRGQYPRFLFNAECAQNAQSATASPTEEAECAENDHSDVGAECAENDASATTEASENAQSGQSAGSECAENDHSALSSHVRNQGVFNGLTTSPPSSPPSAGAQARDVVPLPTSAERAVQQLRVALGEFSPSVDAMLASCPESAGRWASYVRSAWLEAMPLDHEAIAAVGREDRPRIVALTLERFAAAGLDYDNRLFRKFLLKVVADRNGDAGDDVVERRVSASSRAAARAKQVAHLA